MVVVRDLIHVLATEDGLELLAVSVCLFYIQTILWINEYITLQLFALPVVRTVEPAHHLIHVHAQMDGMESHAPMVMRCSEHNLVILFTFAFAVA